MSNGGHWLLRDCCELSWGRSIIHGIRRLHELLGAHLVGAWSHIDVGIVPREVPHHIPQGNMRWHGCSRLLNLHKVLIVWDKFTSSFVLGSNAVSIAPAFFWNWHFWNRQNVLQRVFGNDKFSSTDLAKLSLFYLSKFFEGWVTKSLPMHKSNVGVKLFFIVSHALEVAPRANALIWKLAWVLWI